MKIQLPNHMKLNKKDKSEFRLMKQRIKSWTLFDWFFWGLVVGFILFLAILVS